MARLRGLVPVGIVLMSILFTQHQAQAAATTTPLWEPVSEKTFPLPKECAYTHSLLSADGYLFGGIWSQSNASCIWRLDPKTGAVIYATSSVSGLRVGGDHMLYDPVHDTLYTIETYPSTHILSIDPHSLVVQSHSIAVTEPERSLPSMASDGKYFYVVNNIPHRGNSLLYKIAMTDYTVAATSTLPGSEYHAILYDGQHLFLTTTPPRGYVVETDTNLTILQSTNVTHSRLCTGYTNELAEAGNYIYLGCEFGFYGIRMQKDDFTKHSYIYVGGPQYAVTYTGTYILYGTYSGVPDVILVYDPHTQGTFGVHIRQGSPNKITTDGEDLFTSIWGKSQLIMFSTVQNRTGAKKVLD